MEKELHFVLQREEYRLLQQDDVLNLSSRQSLRLKNLVEKASLCLVTQQTEQE